MPLWAVTPEKLADAVKRIVALAHPRRIILFGSRAHDAAGPDSDVDLLVVEDVVPNRYTETVRLRRALAGVMMPIDLLVIGERDFQAASQWPGSVYRVAQQEGRVLYDAA